MSDAVFILIALRSFDCDSTSALDHTKELGTLFVLDCLFDTDFFDVNSIDLIKFDQIQSIRNQSLAIKNKTNKCDRQTLNRHGPYSNLYELTDRFRTR